MKSTTLTITTLIVVGLLIVGSCKKDDNAGNNSDVPQIVSTGTWRVSLFTEPGEDKTSDFTGYTFTFTSGGPLMAASAGTTTTGTWGWDDSSNKLLLSIGTVKPLLDLTDDWIVLEKTETLLRLRNDNTTKEELLTFSRN
jgi:hypothetical protein